MIQGKILSYNDDLSKVQHIRNQVILDENGDPKELNQNLNDDQNLKDEFSLYAIVFESNEETEAVASARMYYDGEKIWIDQIAVLKEHRHKGYGDFLMKMLISKAQVSNFSTVYMKAPAAYIDFFKKLGFISLEEVYWIAKIKHVKMYLNTEDFLPPCKKRK